MFRLFKSKSSLPQPAPGAAVGYSSDLIDPKVMEQIGYLELLSRSVVDGLLAGKHRSTTKGGCCEFSQHRQYAPGDEIRQIDWQVFARNDKYFVRQFEEETNLHAVMALDTSGSMKFGLSTVSKLDYARQAASCVARISLRIVRARGHDVVVMHVLAPEEIHFDFRRWSSFQSLEVAGHRMILDPAAIRDEYLRRIRAFVERLENIVTGLGGDYVRMAANKDMAETLGWFLRQRAARSK